MAGDGTPRLLCAGDPGIHRVTQTGQPMKADSPTSLPSRHPAELPVTRELERPPQDHRGQRASNLELCPPLRPLLKAPHTPAPLLTSVQAVPRL